MRVLMLSLTALLVAPPAAATSVRELPVEAGRCAILRAFGRPAADCPTPAPGITRGVRAGIPGVIPPAPLTEERGYYIHFDFDSDRLTPAYLAHLERLAGVLTSPPLAASCIRLVGHTDTVGSPAYNTALSLRRAGAVAAVLLTHPGISRARLAVAGMGERAPLPGEPGPSPRNRRVEILVRDPEGPEPCR